MLFTINDLITRSNGELIDVNGQYFWFRRNTQISEADITAFEQTHKVTVPVDYKSFLTTIGACTLFGDETLPGIDFLPPWQWEHFAHTVFHNTGSFLFPEVVLVISDTRTGSVAGFTQCGEFGEFYPDMPPEFWLSDAEFMPFNSWCNELVTTVSGAAQ